MMPKYPVLQGIIGAIAAFLVALVLEIGVLMLISGMLNERLMPRGIGWIAIPIVSGIAGWRFGKEIGAEAIAAVITSKLAGQNRSLRFWLAGSVLWLACALSFYGVFNPYGYYWSNSEWHQFWLVIVAPPVLGLVGQSLFRWANR